ncbi:nucleotidyltransferase, partial [Chitinophaga sp.]|uniref:nucleotidyltransferase n=1 Tax=Chitinophaga sp. TaxID=1869181 RepID=UPI002F940847
EKEDFLKSGYITQIGYPPLRIDILNNIDGVEFVDAIKDMQKVEVEDGFKINYIGLKDFIQNKQASGRSQDLSDIKEIQKKIAAPKKSGKDKKGSKK